MISISLYLLCKKAPALKYVLLLLVMLNICIPSAKAEASAGGGLLYPKLVEQFYTLNDNRLIWTGPDANSAALRRELQQLLDRAQLSGLDKGDYHYGYISQELRLYNDMNADRIFTDAAIAYLKDLYTGRMDGGMLGYDGVSEKFKARDNENLLSKMAQVQDAAGLEKIAETMEPMMPQYTALKEELSRQLTAQAKTKINMLGISLNYYRRIHHYGFKKCIVVNICRTMLNYYQDDSMMLEMKVVVGKSKTKTPRFSAFCYEAIMYPY